MNGRGPFCLLPAELVEDGEPVPRGETNDSLGACDQLSSGGSNSGDAHTE